MDPWHVNPGLFRFVEKKIIHSGCLYVHYSFASEILTADLELTLLRIETFSRQIWDEVDGFGKQNAITHITVIGVSFSCVTAGLIANNNPLGTELIIVVLGHSLADSMWYGLRTRNLKETMGARGIGLAQLQKQWEKLAPEYYLPKLKDKKIKIIISNADRIIPAPYGRRHADKARKIISSLAMVENRWLGHYASILHYAI